MFDYWRELEGKSNYFILFHPISSFSKVPGYLRKLCKPGDLPSPGPMAETRPAAEGTPQSPPCPGLAGTPWTPGSRRKDVLGIQVQTWT